MKAAEPLYPEEQEPVKSISLSANAVADCLNDSAE
jgi:hypothetical protein